MLPIGTSSRRADCVPKRSQILSHFHVLRCSEGRFFSFRGVFGMNLAPSSCGYSVAACKQQLIGMEALRAN
jgi:hypothetical protein